MTAALVDIAITTVWLIGSVFIGLALMALWTATKRVFQPRRPTKTSEGFEDEAAE